VVVNVHEREEVGESGKIEGEGLVCLSMSYLECCRGICMPDDQVEVHDAK
jgi:hypothetical protein